jgi:hypothetical protein
MTARTWRGDAVAIAQITTITRPAPTGSVSFTIGGKTLSFGSWDVATIVSTWNNTASSPDPVAASAPFAAIVAGSSGDALTLTARVPGEPFFVTVKSGDSDATNQMTDEIQTIVIGNAPTGGTFTLSYGGITTGNIAYNASAATVQTALTGLASIGAGNCVVTGPDGGPWRVQFTGSLAAQNLPLITGSRANLTGGTAGVTIETLTDGQTGTNAVQTLSLQSVTAGTFTLTFSGATTGNIAWNASAATVQAALEALSTIGAGNITATGGALPSAVTLTFGGALAARAVPAITGNGAALTTTIAATITETTAGATGPNLRGRVTIPNTAEYDSTAWRLRLVYDGTVYRSGIFRRANTAANLLLALESLTPIGAGNVTTTTGAALSDGTRYDDFELINARAGRHPVTEPIVIGNLTVEYVSGTPSPSPRQIILLQYPGGTNEKQTLALSGTPTSGTFTLSFGGQTTAPIAYNATAAAVGAALNALSTIGEGGVTCTGGALPGANVVIEFRSNGLQASNVALVTSNVSGLNPVIVQTTPAVNGIGEVQRYTLTGDPFGGTLTLTVGANTTGAIAYNASAATVQTALEGLASVGSGKVVCTGGPWPTAIVATFASSLGNVAQATGATTLHNATLTITETTPGGGLAVVTTTRRSRGPNHWDDPGNWSPAGLPDWGDDAYLDGNSDCLWGLRQRATFTANAALNTITILDPSAPFQTGQKIRVRSSTTLPGGLSASTDYYLTKSAVAAADNVFHLSTSATGAPVDITSAGTGTHTVGIKLASLRIPARFTGALGLPVRSDAGDVEYRPTSLEIDVDTVVIGAGPGTGSGRLRLITTTATTCTVYTTSGSTETGESALEWCPAAASSLVHHQGDTALAIRAGQTAVLSSCVLNGGTLYLGPGATVSALEKTGGTLITDTATLTGPLTSTP